ncbi:MAG: nucleotidyltransferase family protein [Verrucomicrobiota bacterium]|nr:nucleotidyltransferase family protein [Verrucomicrobiota bacterium]
MKISAIILAAGSARRMGCQKMLLPMGALTLIEHVTREVILGGVDRCLVVTGSDRERIGPLVETAGATEVHNKHHLDGGMLSSVRCGLEKTDSETNGFLFCLGDQPGITAGMIHLMLEKVRSMRTRILVPVCQGKRGHPLYVAASYKVHIERNYENVGLRGLLEEFRNDVYEWEYPNECILSDLDTPEDYARWMALHARVSDSPVSPPHQHATDGLK